MCKSGIRIIFLKNPKAFWTPIKWFALFLQICHTLSGWNGCVVWHHNLTTAQSDRLEALQKHALRIILHPVTVPYPRSLRMSLLSCDDANFSRNCLNRSAILETVCMTSSHLNLIPPFLTGWGILQFTPSSGPNKTLLLLHKLIPKVLPVTTFHIYNSAISFHFMCVFHTFCIFYLILTNCRAYLYLCFILVVFYIVFVYSVSL